LNMTYDVPVKLFSFHLMVMSLVLLAPDASRLMNVLVLNRPAGPSTEPPLVRGRRGLRALVALQLVFGAYAVALNSYAAWTHWYEYGGGAPRSPLYGLWNVEELSIDGQVRSPLITDYGRWRRAIFQSPNAMTFQRMDDTFAGFIAGFDTNIQTLTLRKQPDKSLAGTLAIHRANTEELVLDGDMDGRKVRMRLRRIDRASFLLVSRGFHWVQEYPFNR